MPPAPICPGAPGLRERKKLRTRRAIRTAAYQLFAADGYDATSVERIAEAAEVSPSTVFRYFPTKEEIVLTDEYDPLIEAELARRPAEEPPVRAVVAALTSSLDHLFTQGAQDARDRGEALLRLRLVREIPAVRNRLAEHHARTTQLLARALAERSGHDLADLELRIVCVALVASFTEAVFAWADSDGTEDVTALVTRCLGVLERGLTL